VCHDVCLEFLGDVVEDLTVLTVQKGAGVLLARTADLDRLDPAAAPQATEDDEDGKEGSKKKRALAQAQKQQRERDEEVLGVFVSKSSLAASLDPEEQASAEVIEIDRIPKVYKVGGKVPSVKVKGYNLVEGWAIGTNITDVVEGEVAHTSDVQVGQLQQVTVEAIKDFGLVVRLGHGRVTAVCPTFHTADVVVEGKLTKKFKPGQELTMRVWEVSDSGIIMTNKKSVVELPQEAAICSYTSDATALGATVTGVVSKINLQGVHVRFFNKVRGMVPMTVLVQQGVVDPDDAYRAGQVLRAVIIGKTLPADGAETDVKATLYLALNMSKDVSALLKLMDGVSAPAGTIAHATSGTASAKKTKTSEDAAASAVTEGTSDEIAFVSGSIYKFEDDVALVRLDNGKVARLQKHHVYDLASTGDALFGAAEGDIKVGIRVENALVLSYTKGVPVITLKPLLLAAARGENSEMSIPSKVADMSPGQLVAGVVVKVDTFGVIVRFRGGLSALAPRPSIADRFVPTPVGLFNVGDSIRCLVQRVDLASEKAIISLKPSLVAPSGSGINYLTALLRERHLAAVVASRSSKKLYPNWQKFAVGSVVKATVTALESYGVVLTGDDNATMLLARNTSADRLAELTVGKSVKARVLDVDFANCVLEVSLDSAFTKTADAATPGKKDKKSVATPSSAAEALEDGVKYDAIVGLVKDTHLVVLIKKSVVAYVMLADYHCTKPEAGNYTVGQKLAVRLQVKGDASASQAFPHAAVSVLTVYDESSARDASNRHARLTAESTSAADDIPAEALKQRFIDKLRVGQLLSWVVSEVSATEMKVLPERHEELGLNIKAVVHVSGAVDTFTSFDNLQKVLKKATGANREAVSALHPFHGLAAGGKVWCHVLQVRRESTVKAKETVEEFLVYLSLSTTNSLAALSKMGITAAAADSRTELKGEGYLPFHRMQQAQGKDELKCPSLHAAVITKLEDVSCIVSLSPYLTARLNYIDVSADSDTVEQFVRKCFVGMRLVVAVTQMSKDNNRIKNVRVTRAAVEALLNDADNLFDLTRSKSKLNDVALADPEYEEGQVVNALLNLHVVRVPKPPAISVSLAGHKLGRVCATEIWDRDEWMDLSELHAQAAHHVVGSGEVLSLPDGRAHGQVVQARVLSVTDGGVELSLRPSRVVRSHSCACLHVHLKLTPFYNYRTRARSLWLSSPTPSPWRAAWCLSTWRTPPAAAAFCASLALSLARS
jgi:ribosomal protein S1